MDSFTKALSARCDLAMYRVMNVIGIDENDDALINHSVAAYEHAHDLGYSAFSAGRQPSVLIASDSALLKYWEDGKDDARCFQAIANLDHQLTRI